MKNENNVKCNSGAHHGLLAENQHDVNKLLKLFCSLTVLFNISSRPVKTVHDLNLSKNQSQLFASRLGAWNLPQKNVLRYPCSQSIKSTIFFISKKFSIL
jgi:hypothetical protein